MYEKLTKWTQNEGCFHIGFFLTLRPLPQNESFCSFWLNIEKLSVTKNLFFSNYSKCDFLKSSKLFAIFGIIHPYPYPYL